MTTGSRTPKPVEVASIRVAPDELPRSAPTVRVENTQETYDGALAAGAESVSPPAMIIEGVCIAMVRAPGGVLIGMSGPTD
jgi:hypothetical protein